MTTNPFQKTRLKSIFSEPPSPTFRGGGIMSRRPTQNPEQDSNSQYFDEIMRMRNNPGPGTTAYRQALNEMPTPEEYKPNWLTRIASGLSGFSAGYRDPAAGITTARSLNEAPYRTAMEQYGNRLGTLEAGANIEREEAESTIKAMAEARALGLKYDEYKLKRDMEFSKSVRDDRLADSTIGRNTAYSNSLNRPEYESVAEEGGTRFVNKRNPNENTFVAGKTIGTGNLNVGRTNAAANTRQAGAAEQNARTASANSMTAALNAQSNADNVRSMIAARAANTANQGRNVDSLVKQRAGRTAPGISPTQQSAATDLALEQLFMDPQYRQFIVSDNQGHYDAADPDDIDDDAAYEVFTEELNDRIDQILRRGATGAR